MRWRTVCKLARRLAEVEEGATYGSPALRVRGSLVARLLDDKRSILVKAGQEQRDGLCASKPEGFTVPAEYRNLAVMVVRLASVGETELWPVLVESRRRSGAAEPGDPVRPRPALAITGRRWSPATSRGRGPPP